VPQTTTTTEGTTTTTLPPSPVVATEGDENDVVAAIQFLLGCGGYGDLTVDGEFGPATTTAVESAQTALGFEVTGEPTEDLFALLSRTCNEDRVIEPGDDPVTVVGHTAAGEPEEFTVSLLFGSTLTVRVVSGEGVSVIVRDAAGMPLESADGTAFAIAVSGDHTIEVSTAGDPTLFTLEVGLASIAEAGDWIITTDGIAYGDTQFVLGTAAAPMIDKIFEFLGHGVRTEFDEFDTGWEAPGQEGFRGIFIEGIAFLFYGPNDDDPDRPETFARVRYVGPSFDANGDPRPAGYVQTLSGITVGHTLADLQDTYGSQVRAGSNSEEHYYRYGAADGSEVCFYFGEDAPTDSSQIVEISTECRG
jgi:peptidoglycan hydrolase-like protein with peptidoglycan-binding domain